MDMQLIFRQIEELKLNINKKEDDWKNLINEKDNIIKILNEKLLEQEKRITNNEREIKILNEKILNQKSKIEEIDTKNGKELKEKENQINKINNSVTIQEKEIKEIKTDLNNINIHLTLKCFTRKSFRERISSELSKVKILEEKYGFLSSIGIKLLVPQHDYEIEGFIKAPENSLYKNGIFNFVLQYPKDYPMSPPKFLFKTRIFHCNVIRDGNNDLNQLLRSFWKEYTELSIILGNIYQFFLFHCPESPFDLESAQLYIRNFYEFKNKCQKYVKKYALLEFNEKLDYLFQNNSYNKRQFPNSSFTSVFVESLKEERISKGENANFERIYNDKNIILIAGNKVFSKLNDFKDIQNNLNNEIIFIIPNLILISLDHSK